MANNITNETLSWTLDINGNKSQKALGDVEQKTRRLKSTNKDLRVEMQKMESQGKKNTKEYKQLQDQYKKNNAAIRANEGRMKSLRKEIGINGLTAKQLRKRYRELKTQMDNTTPNTAQWKKYDNELKQVSRRMDDVKGSTKKTNSVFGSLKGSLTGLLPMLSLGTIVMGIQRLGRMQDELIKTKRDVANLTQATGEELKGITAQVRALSKTFNTDYKEVLIAANSVAKQFDITQTEALNKIEKGFIHGANASGEFLNQLKEYPTQFSEAQLTADDLFSVITQSVKSGIYSDKGADAVKEATIRIREMNTATQEAMDGIGLSAEEIQKQLEEGTISLADVIRMVSERLNELPAESEAVGKAIADIFGGPGEDAGIKFLTTLKDIGGEYDDILDKSNEFAQQQERLLESSKALETVWQDIFGKKSWWKEFKIGVNGLITVMLNFEKAKADMYKNLFGMAEEEKATKELKTILVDEIILPKKNNDDDDDDEDGGGGGTTRKVKYDIFWDKEKLQEEAERLTQEISDYIEQADKEDKDTNPLGLALDAEDERIQKVKTNAQYEQELWRETYEGRKQAQKDMLKAGEIAEREYKDNVIAIEREKRTVQMELAAQAIGNMASIFGENTIAYKALASAQALINTYLAASKALTQGPVIGPILAATITAQGLAQVAKINGVGVEKPSTSQAATGRYDVIGEDDGRSYSAGYEPKPKTGIYSSPTLFAETGRELIVDPATTRNIQMNNPAILEAINAMRVPQRAAGNYQQAEQTQPAQQQAPAIDPRMTEILERNTAVMEKISKEGVRGKWVIRDLEEKQSERNASKNQVKR